MVPHLITALTGPINEIEQRVLESMPAIERWFRLEWMEHTPVFYSSVDLRNAGYKLAPVDTQLFPTGFDNLTPEMAPLSVQAAMAAIEKICPEAKNLLLVPDRRQRSPFYLQHLQRLMQVFTQAGLNVRLGRLSDEGRAVETLALPDGGELRLEPLVRARGRLGLKDFDPCTVLLNDDLGEGVPQELLGLHQQYLLPPLHAGWGVRRRLNHLRSYEEVAKKFAKLLGMDHWLLTPMHADAGTFERGSAASLEALQAQADAMLGKVRRKFKEYGIAERPFVVVKCQRDDGRMRPLTLRDARDLAADGPAAAALAEAAGGAAVELLVQEGVPTYERVNDAVAEPVVCMIDRYVVGGYYRIHAGRASDEALRGPGSQFVPLAFAENHQMPRAGVKPGASAPNRFYMYGVVGRLAMLAAAYELEATDPEAEIYE
jgi:glutamate--cysteine ligase